MLTEEEINGRKKSLFTKGTCRLKHHHYRSGEKSSEAQKKIPDGDKAVAYKKVRGKRESRGQPKVFWERGGKSRLSGKGDRRPENAAEKKRGRHSNGRGGNGLPSGRTEAKKDLMRRKAANTRHLANQRRGTRGQKKTPSGAGALFSRKTKASQELKKHRQQPA